MDEIFLRGRTGNGLKSYVRHYGLIVLVGEVLWMELRENA